MRGGGLRPNRPKTFARNPTLPQEVAADVSIYDKGPFPSGNFSFWSLERAHAREAGIESVNVHATKTPTPGAPTIVV